eukprot:434701_1
MPGFLKARKLELDEQIIFDNCGKSWMITTHKGATVCKAVKYNNSLNKHYMKFYDTNGYPNDDKKWIGLRVSVENDVAKKHCWFLDLMHLHQVGLMGLKQFERVKVDRAWTNAAHDAMTQAKSKHVISPYWICGFCRGYVKESKASIKHLGRLLSISDIELKILHKVNPSVCPNCYRVRFERQRWEFVWEILSLWTFYFIVFPILFIIFGIMMLLRIIRDPAEMARTWEILKTRIYNDVEEVVEFVTHENHIVNKEEKARYVSAHYSDTQLIANLNSASREHRLFDSNVRDVVWEKLYIAKDAIDPFLLKGKINNHIMSISAEDELTPY